ncbi:twin-arginine translocase TatA/TatE family subunit [Lacimicrobium alkaliphilum]|uniref:Sec-independent protein translocase protein TatA n=1 Tax=Lacimicrobium alkaliphilum TaxID=1526571 RepID=A0A0U3AR61_9ALTE|nr:twin-arginine translocase TatA/TatE family subunit [Lacimicrobium alkaliphilum]ALT00371.1 hypothetical protein AT746_06900 [Lacimicrobium alkaliphilum]
MGLSVWQIALVVMLFLLLFGRGKIPALMSDLAEGIRGFKQGMQDKDEQSAVNNPDSDIVRTKTDATKALRNEEDSTSDTDKPAAASLSKEHTS